MLNIELAREWSLRALAECPLEAKDVRFYIEHNPRNDINLDMLI
jgi:hypothetical protein